MYKRYLTPIHTLLLLTAVSGISYFFAIGDENWVIPFLTLPLLNIFLIPFSLKKEGKDVFSPLVFIGMSLLIGTVLRSFFILSPLESDVKHLMLMGNDPSILLLGVLQIYLGIIFFVIGYLRCADAKWNWSKKPIFSIKFSRRKLTRLSLIALSVSAVATFLFFKELGLDLFTLLASEDISKKRFLQLEDGGFASLGYYRILMDFSRVIFFMLLVYLLSNPKAKNVKTTWLLLFLSGFLSLAIPFLNSSRADSILVLIFSFIIIYYIKGRVSKGIWVPIVSFGVVLLVTMTFLRSKAGYGDKAKTQNVFAIVVGSLNFLGVEKASYIAKSMPEKMEFQYGKTLVLWTVAPIPRTVWKDKPETSIGRVIGEKIYEKRDEKTQAGGVPPGFITELFMNFGLIGVPFGMFAFGYVIKRVYNSLYTIRNVSQYGVLIYVLIVLPFCITLIEGDLSRSIVDVFRSIIPLYIFIKLVKLRI